MHSAILNTDLHATDWRRVSRIADLADIFEPSVQVCSWQRCLDISLTSCLAETTQLVNLNIREVLKAGDQVQLVELPKDDGYELLRADITFLAEILCDLVECTSVGIRIVAVNTAMCPRWHIDHVPIRMLCTYTGSGTQWLNDQGVDKSRLEDSKVVASNYQQAAAGDVVLLKGALWHDNSEFGAIHRSPSIAAGEQQRLLLTLDPIWAD